MQQENQLYSQTYNVMMEIYQLSQIPDPEDMIAMYEKNLMILDFS